MLQLLWTSYHYKFAIQDEVVTKLNLFSTKTRFKEILVFNKKCQQTLICAGILAYCSKDGIAGFVC